MGFGLYALTLQDNLDFEVVIADDGSTPDVEKMIADFAATVSFPVKFVTHEDNGYRRSTILNKATLASSGQKLIYMDGDCVPFSNHVSLHVQNLKPGFFCVGGRVMVSLEDSRALTKESIKAGRLADFLTPAATKHLRDKHRTSILQSALGMRRGPRIIGCNCSFMRDDLFRVNGYDETYNGFGKEDSDLRNRLRNNGFKGVSLFTQDIVCHLDHSLDKKSHTSVNKRGTDKVYYESRKKALTAVKGLKELQCPEN